jgi:hypothetical protein
MCPSFCVEAIHIRFYFALKICTGKYQDNMYMPEIFFSSSRNFEIAIFFKKKRYTYTCVNQIQVV